MTRSTSKLRKIKTQLTRAYNKLEREYNRKYYSSRINHIYVDEIEFLLNKIKLLEYHYRDDVERIPKKKVYKKACKLLEKYGFQETDDIYSKFKLRKKYREGVVL